MYAKYLEEIGSFVFKASALRPRATGAAVLVFGVFFFAAVVF